MQNNRSLVAFSVRVLEDLNEVTSHMLEVVNAHMQQSKPQSMVSLYFSHYTSAFLLLTLQLIDDIYDMLICA